jgi:beta-galactosidase
MSASDEAARLGRIRAKLGKVGFGGDYNPEQWPAEVWAADIELMRHAGVDLVTVGVFGWAQVEPEPGKFEFGLFDRIIDDLYDAGIHLSLATMTASPPAWLSAAHPEMLPMRAGGTRLWHGARQNYCPSSPVYRDHAVRLVEQLATRYGHHPALAVWHVGNEYGVHVAECYCDVSAGDFQGWLHERYGSIEAFNDAWSTAFWSQRYGSFDQVLPPRSAPTYCNPAQQLDFARFSSDAMLACYRAEVDVLRRVSPDVPVTTNFCGIWKPVDYWAWAPHLDLVSLDSYPDPAEPESHIEAALSYDLARSLKDGRPWLLMEQAPAAVNWRARNASKAPGAMRLGSWQAVARGADAVLFFQWRQSRGGAEKWHSGMVPHTGPESRTFGEVAELGAELAAHPHLAGARVEAEVAVVMDWPNWWALELDSHPSVDVTMREALLSHYAPLFEAGVTCDVVPSTGDLTGYRLVVVPNLYLTTAEAARNLTDYVRQGGHLVVSFFSGIVDECDRAYLGGYLGPLRDLVGARVEEWLPLQEHASLKVQLGDTLGGGACHASVWSEVVVPSTAEVVGSFHDGDLAGAPAVLRNTFGAGTAWYVATRLDRAGMREVVRAALAEAGVAPVVAGLPAGVEAVARICDDGTRVTFLLNHGSAPASVPLPDSRSVAIGPRGVAILDAISSQRRN